MAIVDGRIEHEITIAATAEAVFGYFTDPKLLVQWIGMDAELEPEPAGVFRCVMNGDYTAIGRYVEVSPPHRVVFTWGWAGNPSVPPGSSTVTITLSAQAGGTRVRLVHDGLPASDVAHHDQGWSEYLPKLAAAITG